MDDFADLPVDSLRRLARGLLYDRADAEDVVQEAWLVALRRSPPREDLGRWMAGTVRNLASRARRDQRHRREREERAARPEAQPGAADVLARIELLHQLLDAVGRVEEPYRTAIGLRFFDDLAPREIAKRQGLPVNTVRTHVRRGLERLRRELEGGSGRGSFLPALIPLAGKTPWSVLLGLPVKPLVAVNWIGGLVVQKKLLLAGAVLFVLGLSWFVVNASKDAPPSAGGVAEAPDRPAAAQGAAPASDLSAPDPDAAGRAALAASSETATWVLRGHVTRGLSEPFPRARLLGRVFENRPTLGKPLAEAHLSADENGDFVWPMEPPGTSTVVKILTDMEDTASWEFADYFERGDAPPEPWLIYVLPLDCTVRGVIRDSAGKGVAGARIAHRDWKLSTSSDADGRFSMRLPTLDSGIRLYVLADGFAQATVSLGQLGPGEHTCADVILAAEMRIRGRVIDERGIPIEGAQVSADRTSDALPSVSTDAEGRFELGTLDRDAEKLSIEASKTGYVRSRVPVKAEDRLDGEVEIRLARGVHVTGRVVSADGAPVAGARVEVSYWKWSAEPGSSIVSDEQGVFALDCVARGAQNFWVHRKGFTYERHEVEIPATGDRLDGVELVVERGHFLAGIVQGVDGKPLPWAMVYVEAGGRKRDSFAGAQSHSGADGRFRITDLPSTMLVIGVLAQGYARFEEQCTDIDREDLVLKPVLAAALAGRVLDDATGSPITAFRVRASDSLFASEGQRPRTLPGAWGAPIPFESPDGAWILEHDFEAQKVLRIEIEADGYAPAVLDPVLTSLDRNPDANVARLVHGTLVRGRVVEAGTGAAFAGARVRAFRHRDALRSPDTRDVYETKSDDAGRFELVDVPTGTVSLAVEVEGSALVIDGPFEIAGAGVVERTIEVALASGAQIRGRLLDIASHGLAGEKIALRGLDIPGDRREWFATTTEDGSFGFEGLAEGAYHLSWARSQAGVSTTDLLQLVRLAKDQNLTLDLQPKGSATVRGRIRFDGTLPETISVTLFPDFNANPEADPKLRRYAHSARGGFAVNGEFVFEGVEPGGHVAIASFQLADGSDAGGSSGMFQVPDRGLAEIVVVLEKQ